MSRLYMIPKLLGADALDTLHSLISTNDQVLLRADGTYLLLKSNTREKLAKFDKNQLLVLKEDAAARAIDVPSTFKVVNDYHALVKLTLDHNNACDWLG